MRQECKIPKRNRFTVNEESEIVQAMNNLGIYDYRKYVMWASRYINDQKKIRNQIAENISYRCSNLYTIHNQLRAGINVQENAKLFIKEAGWLCQELKSKV